MKGNSFYLICRFFLYVFLRTCFRFTVTGRAYIPRQGGCIIASNHLSYLDPIVLSVASPRILSFMSKQELFDNKWFAILIRALNAFPLQRGSADMGALRGSIDKLKKGDTLIVFPEGTRKKNGQAKEVHAGVSMLAAKAGVPVIPACIEGTDRALPAHSRKISLFLPIRVSFGEPLTLSNQVKGKEIKAGYQRFSKLVIQRINMLKMKNDL